MLFLRGEITHNIKDYPTLEYFLTSVNKIHAKHKKQLVYVHRNLNILA